MKYFHGKKGGMGVVYASQATTFRELVGQYVNIAVPLACTREQYAAMSRDEQNKAKSVGYLIAAEMKESPANRKIEKAKQCNLIFLDVDADKKTNHAPARQFVENPDVLATSLSPFAHVCHHTTSSTRDKPRIRIIVSAEAIPVGSYHDAVATICRRIGLSVSDVDRSSSVTVQPMYLPSLFAGEDDHPMFLCDLEGRAFTTADIESSGAAPQQKKGNTATAADNLEFLKSPVQDITLEIAAQALKHLDADCEYREWLDVAAALHHQFPDEEEAAYQLFDAWSASGSKYPGDEETRVKWDSFTYAPAGRLPKTMRTVLKRAQEAGWDGGKVKEQGFQNIMAWLNEGAGNITTLLAESLQRILATPLLTQAERDALLHQVAVKAKKRFGVTISLTSMRKDLQALQARMDSEKEGKAGTPAWVKGICYVVERDEFFKHRTNEKIKPQAFDRAYARHLMSVTDGKDVTELALRPSDYALNTVKVPVVYSYEYNPAQADEIFSKENGRVYVNTYRRSYPIPDAACAKEAGETFQGHLELLITEPWIRCTLTDFFAYIVQHPGKKIRWAPFLQGAEGCGKSYLKDVASAVLGSEHVLGLNPKAALSGWTEWSGGHQLVVLEEIRVAGVNRHEMMNVLKPLITNATITVNQRFADTRQIYNVTNYMVLSNHHDALAISPSDRRYFVIKSKLQTKQQVSDIPREHFNNLYEQLHTNAGGLRSYFENWKISEDFNPDGHAPWTPYLEQLIHDSANDTTAAVRKLIIEHEHPLIQCDLISNKVLVEFLENQERIQRVNPQHIASVLRDEGFTQRGRFQIGDERHYLWVSNEAWHIDNPGLIANQRVTKGGGEHYAEMFF